MSGERISGPHTERLSYGSFVSFSGPYRLPRLQPAVRSLSSRVSSARWQMRVLVEALHEAELPKGLLNVVAGLGKVVGAELLRNPDYLAPSGRAFDGSRSSIRKSPRSEKENLCSCRA
jgi:hypothetical protein